jgi:hypothetical protein
VCGEKGGGINVLLLCFPHVLFSFLSSFSSLAPLLSLSPSLLFFPSLSLSLSLTTSSLSLLYPLRLAEETF